MTDTMNVVDNKVVCSHCHSVLVSLHKNHHQTCTCTDPNKQVIVSGGRDFYKRTFGPLARWRDIDNKVYLDGVEQVGAVT